MKTAVHTNSLQAFHSEQPKLSAREQLVYDYILEHGPRTDRELAYGLGFGENLNATRPRVTELIKRGRLMEVGSIECPVTHKRVRRVDVSRPRDLFGLAS